MVRGKKRDKTSLGGKSDEIVDDIIVAFSRLSQYRTLPDINNSTRSAACRHEIDYV